MELNYRQKAMCAAALSLLKMSLAETNTMIGLIAENKGAGPVQPFDAEEVDFLKNHFVVEAINDWEQSEEYQA